MHQSLGFAEAIPKKKKYFGHHSKKSESDIIGHNQRFDHRIKH